MMKNEKVSEFSRQEIEKALKRVIGTPEFKSAYRLRQLIEHLVTKELAGESADLKGYNIGLDVFEKGKDFDPDTDTIVRVQMVRLRRMLEHYYLTTGKDDPLIIDVPKGRYVPAYSRNERVLEKQVEAQKAVASRAPPKGWIEGLRTRLTDDPLLLLLGMGVMTLMFALLMHVALTPAKTDMVKAPYRMPDGPSIAVLPFNNETGDKAHDVLVRGFPAHIVHTLTRYKELLVFAPDTTLNKHGSKQEQRTTALKVGARYTLFGGFGIHKDTMGTSVFLMDTESGRIIWSKSYTRWLTGDNLHAIQINIASHVAQAVGQPYGLINRLETKLLAGQKKESYKAYQCVLQFYEYAQRESEAMHLFVRKCLQETVANEPRHAQAWAALAWMYVDEYRNNFNPMENPVSALDRAYSAARTAVKIDPDDAFTHRYLANVLITRDNSREAEKAIRRAADLNPNDANVMADMGWILKNTGKWTEAFPSAMKAIRLNPGHPPWYLEAPILYHFANQDCTNAHQLARKYYKESSSNLMREVFLTATGMLCKKAAVAQSVRALNTQYPAFLTRPRQKLRDLAIPAELHDPIISNLQEAGVVLDAGT